MSLSETLEAMRELPGAHVDRNFGLGQGIVGDQLRQMSADFNAEHIQDIEQRCVASLAEIQLRIRPYVLPHDYRAFLEQCGGIKLDEPSGRHLWLDIFGIGPGVTCWYTSLLEANDFALPEPLNVLDWGFGVEDPLPRDAPAPRQLLIGMWHRDLDEGEAAEILSKRPDLLKPLPPGIKVRDNRLHWEQVEFSMDLAGDVSQHGILLYRRFVGTRGQRLYQKVAGSFSEWLESIVQHQGHLEYLLG